LIVEMASKIHNALPHEVRIRLAQLSEQMRGSPLLAEIELLLMSAHSNRSLCIHCGQALTEGPAELDAHIQAVAEQAAAQFLTWPVEIFRERARAKMEPGDRIVWLTIGGFVIHKRDGSRVTVWRSDA